jgi:Ca2+-binding EF-hand superfamily protein
MIRDTDSKGFLRPDELKDFLMGSGEKFSQEEFDELLASCVDPQEGKVFYEDYVKILAK